MIVVGVAIVGAVVEHIVAYCVAETEVMVAAVQSTYFQECTHIPQADHDQLLLPFGPFPPCWVSEHVLAPAAEVCALDASETVPWDSVHVVVEEHMAARS